MERFSKPEWITDTVKFECVQNRFGQWWPKMATKQTTSTYWYEVIIRDRNPFKTLNGAIKYIEATIKRTNDRKIQTRGN